MFKVTKFVFEPDEKTGFVNRNYVTVDSKLSWQKAKELRSKDRDLQIVKMR